MLKDTEAIKNILKNNKINYFGILYDRYSNKVYNKCIALIQDKEIAKDLTHDIFLKAFVSLGSFKENSSFSTWLYSITYNSCMDYLRKTKKFIKVEIIDDYKYLNSIDEGGNDDSIYHMDPQRLKKLLEQIPTDDKIILLMKYQDDMSIKDIQQAYNISESATKMRLKRAKKKLIIIYNKLYRHNISTL